MTLNELTEALNKDTPLIWNDPDPVWGRNYSIYDLTMLYATKDTPESEMCAYIKYGDGRKATVYISEIEIDPRESALVLNKKNNVFLWLYKVYNGNHKGLPDSLCPLFWEGLLALLLIILSPVTVLVMSIIAMARGRSLAKHLYINDYTMWGVFWIDKGIIFIYCLGVSLTQIAFGYAKTPILEIPIWVYLFGWLTIPILFYLFVGIGISLSWLSENWSRTKIKNGNLKVITGAIRAKIDKICPTITWK